MTSWTAAFFKRIKEKRERERYRKKKMNESKRGEKVMQKRKKYYRPNKEERNE